MSIVQKCVLKGRLGTVVEFRNVFYGQVEVVAPDTDKIVWHHYLDGILVPILSYLSTIWTMESFDLYSWVAGAWAFVGNEPMLAVGLASGDPLPNAVAGVLIGKTLAKRKMGRKFLGGFTETVSTGNTFTGALLTALGTSLIAYVSTYTSAAGSVLGPGIVTHGGTFYSFVGGVVSALWGSMRRRKPGLGI